MTAVRTDDLIAGLASNVKPVRRLRPPSIRAASWLLLAAIVLFLLCISQGLRSDLAQRLDDPSFALVIGASLSTGILAAFAAFALSLPDRSRLWLFLPVPTLCLWLSNIGYQCLTKWVSIGAQGVTLGETARCFATIVLTGLPLSLAMLVMLRHSALLQPRIVTMMGGLSIAAITATALSLIHPIDATVMILIMNVGVGSMLVLLGGVFARTMFGWVAPRNPTLS
jgi:hypothetical protein